MKFHRKQCEIQYGGRQTGSSYNFGSKADRNVVSSVSTMFSGVAVTMQYRPSCYVVDIYLKFNMAATKKAAILNIPTAILNFSYISMKMLQSRYCIVTATPENMVLALEITFLSAIGPKL